jgi:hypothetical protein
MKITAAAVAAAGGTLWSGHGMNRAYFDNWADLIGLEVTYRSSGRIESARFYGEEITPTSAKRLLKAVERVWVDLYTGKVLVYVTPQVLVPVDPSPEELRRSITSAVLDALAAQTP